MAEADKTLASNRDADSVYDQLAKLSREELITLATTQRQLERLHEDHSDRHEHTQKRKRKHASIHNPQAKNRGERRDEARAADWNEQNPKLGPMDGTQHEHRDKEGGTEAIKVEEHNQSMESNPPPTDTTLHVALLLGYCGHDYQVSETCTRVGFGAPKQLKKHGRV